MPKFGEIAIYKSGPFWSKVVYCKTIYGIKIGRGGIIIIIKHILSILMWEGFCKRSLEYLMKKSIPRFYLILKFNSSLVCIFHGLQSMKINETFIDVAFFEEAFWKSL